MNSEYSWTNMNRVDGLMSSVNSLWRKETRMGKY